MTRPDDVQTTAAAELAAVQAELAQAAARIAEQDQLIADLRFETTHDELTGVLNRKGLAGQWMADVDECDAVVLLDLDHFKSINDTYGHAAGDQVIIHVAQWLARRFRVVARLGGDELVVVDTRPRLADLVDQPLSCVVPLASGPRLAVTATMGITAAVPSLKLTLARADRAMYRAKEAGRGKSAWWSRDLDPDVTSVEQVPVRPAVRRRDTRHPAPPTRAGHLRAVAFGSGEQLYAHQCNTVEWWHEPTGGPINAQGCDGCEAGPAPDGWRPVYVLDGGDPR